MGTPRATVVAVALAAPLACALALAFGSVRLGWGDWLAALAGGGAETAREIVWGLRAPRAAAAFGAGALLAVAGTLLQVLLRNPLADPYLLGVSGGASPRSASTSRRSSAPAPRPARSSPSPLRGAAGPSIAWS